MSNDSNHWESDRLSRKEEADVVLDFMLRRLDSREAKGLPRSFVLNIDAPWGSGKTFFLQNMQRQMQGMGYLVAYVNAWENDHGEDAMLPILSSIKGELDKFSSNDSRKLGEAVIKTGGKLAITVAKGAARQLVNKFLGQEFIGEAGALLEAARDVSDKSLDLFADAAIGAINERVKLVRSFHEQLAEFINSLGKDDPKKKQLFIFIDELDRCRPTYAVEMLERLKHIFNVNGTAFIVATDTTQLRHSISAIYGTNFDSERYLLRFFERRYRLRQKSVLNFVKERFVSRFSNVKISIPPEMGDDSNFITKTVEGFRLSTRDVEQAVETLSDVLEAWPYKAEVEFAYMVPLIAISLADPDTFRAIQSGSIDRQEYFENLRAAMSWEVSMLVADDDGFRSAKRINVSLAAFFFEFYEIRNMDFNQIDKKYRSSTGINNWIGDRMRVELRLEHGGSYMSDQPPRTILSTYVNLIASMKAFQSN